MVEIEFWFKQLHDYRISAAEYCDYSSIEQKDSAIQLVVERRMLGNGRGLVLSDVTEWLDPKILDMEKQQNGSKGKSE